MASLELVYFRFIQPNGSFNDLKNGRLVWDAKQSPIPKSIIEAKSRYNHEDIVITYSYVDMTNLEDMRQKQR
jgi:hypothetical protein